MKWVRISDATRRAIADATIHPFRQTGRRQPDGSWLVPIDDDNAERLARHRLPGESDDDVIIRAIRAMRGDKPY